MKKIIMIFLLSNFLIVFAMEKRLTSHKRLVDEQAERVLMAQEENDEKNKEDNLRQQINIFFKKQMAAVGLPTQDISKNIFVFGMKEGENMVPITLFKTMKLP